MDLDQESVNSTISPAKDQSEIKKDYQENTRPSFYNLNLQQKFTKVIKRIIAPSFPTKHKKEVAKLVTKFFESSENLKVQFTDEFIKDHDYKGDKHWIILAFQQLQQLPNIRQYLKDRLIQDNMEFHKKTTRQQIEVKSIADLARLLFLIMVNCEFVPVNYLIMLAVIMSQQPRMEYPESKASLFNGCALNPPPF